MKQLIVSLSLLVAGAAAASDCKFKRELDERLDVSASEDLMIFAAAGDLVIKAREGLDAVRIKATVCASKQEWMEESALVLTGDKQAKISVVMPDVDWNLSWSGGRYVYMDLDIEVPANLPLIVRDSSGDVEIDGVESVSIKDSSGDMKIENVAGDVEIDDSSGDIELAHINGDVRVNQDSSGDMYGEHIRGNVLVAKDSSGDIRFRQVGQDFVVERDSSGDIVARGIGGDFRVLRDSSGEIDSSDVAGEVDVPDKG